MLKQDQKWWLVSTGAALLATTLTKAALEGGYRLSTGKRPPQNPASPSVDWRTAFGWALAVGVLMSVSQLVAERGAAAGWRRVTGKYPRALRKRKVG